MRSVAKNAFRWILYSVSAYGALFALVSAVLAGVAFAPALGFATALDFAFGLALVPVFGAAVPAASFEASVALFAATRSRWRWGTTTRCGPPNAAWTTLSGTPGIAVTGISNS